MTKEAIEQLRARVAYQKTLLASKSHSAEEEVKEMWRWVNITFMVGIPIVLLSAFYSAFFDVHRKYRMPRHVEGCQVRAFANPILVYFTAHRFEGELPEYMKIRSKEFPWECSDCDIFDGSCWKQCRAAKK